MKTFSKYIAAAAIGTALMTSQAFAATGSLYGLDSWDHPVEGHLSAEDTNIKGRFDAEREVEQWRFTTHFDSLNSKSDDERTAEKYYVTNRIAYKFNQNDYAFVYQSYDNDQFSGFDYQATIAAGYGRRILLPPPMTWDIEVGPGYRYSKLDDSSTNISLGRDGETTDELILRLYTQYTWELSDTSTFQQTLNVESGKETTISKSVTSLKVTVVGVLFV